MLLEGFVWHVLCPSEVHLVLTATVSRIFHIPEPFPARGFGCRYEVDYPFLKNTKYDLCLETPLSR